MNQEILEQLKKLTPEEAEILNGKTEIDKNLYMSSAEAVIDSKKLLDSGKLITVRTHTRFIHFPPHMHNYVEAVYMCEGHTDHIINGNPVTLEKGELLFLNQHATQEILKAGADDIAINFIILPEFFDESLKMIGDENNLIRDFLINCLRNKTDGTGYLHFKTADVLPVQNLIENLIWTLTNPEQDKRSINQITMGLLFLQLINHTDKIASLNHYDQELLLKVYRFIDEHYQDGELTDLAKELHCNLYALSRMITKLAGKSYTELLLAKRLKEAACLLKHTHMPVSDVGYAVGYTNLSYFYRIFKAHFKVSPKEYRGGE